MDNKYYTPRFDEIKPGFKCQSCFWYFEGGKFGEGVTDKDSGFETTWYNVEFTKELYNNIISLIKADAYESEFRARR